MSSADYVLQVLADFAAKCAAARAQLAEAQAKMRPGLEHFAESRTTVDEAKEGDEGLSR